MKPTEPRDASRRVTIYSPTWCIHCPAWKAILGNGDADLPIEYIKSEAPAWVAHYPSVWIDGKVLKDWDRCPTFAEIKALAMKVR